ncbi:hypothetical protein WHR41_01615 [Cladosporium halotolerans]|uniref:Uncharacterized protein n=1 Tax=Cladosporium halotolerans TaxID=1052096 RepID=A0AB34L136_9PEZI
MDAPTLVVAAKLTSITLSLLTSGYGLFASQNILPRLLSEPPRVSTPLFAHIFRTGGIFVVPLSMTSTAASAYLAYALPLERNAWGAAALAALATMPWTGLVMLPGIRRLIEIVRMRGCKGRVKGVGSIWGC